MAYATTLPEHLNATAKPDMREMKHAHHAPPATIKIVKFVFKIPLVKKTAATNAAHVMTAQVFPSAHVKRSIKVTTLAELAAKDTIEMKMKIAYPTYHVQKIHVTLTEYVTTAQVFPSAHVKRSIKVTTLAEPAAKDTIEMKMKIA